MEVRRIEVPFQNTKLIADIVGDDLRVLSLHGGGSSQRHRFRVVREYLLDKGLGSVAFDCIGHGDTGGDLIGSSLSSRTEQAQSVIKYLDVPEPLMVMASSMGGYTALKLTEHVKVDTLLLVAPAAYYKDAYKVPFGEGFAAHVRAAESWNKSDAWEILDRYEGRLLIVSGENDDIIPRAVIHKLYDSAKHARHRELVTLQGVDHGVLRHITVNEFDRKIFLAAVDRLLAA